MARKGCAGEAAAEEAGMRKEDCRCAAMGEDIGRPKRGEAAALPVPAKDDCTRLE